ncbi:MAG: hypothetical protein F6K65_12275 [Moorea sp. SIO3C2]|nr:hypothetical protein [Moorena sp. SIO3C2]
MKLSICGTNFFEERIFLANLQNWKLSAKSCGQVSRQPSAISVQLILSKSTSIRLAQALAFGHAVRTTLKPNP